MQVIHNREKAPQITGGNSQLLPTILNFCDRSRAMPLLLVLIVGLGIGCSANGASQPLTVEHANDVIQYLWWALGLLATFAVFVSSGTGVWIIKTILNHSERLKTLETRCDDNHK